LRRAAGIGAVAGFSAPVFEGHRWRCAGYWVRLLRRRLKSGAKKSENDDVSEMTPPSCIKCAQRAPIAVSMASTDFKNACRPRAVALSLVDMRQATLAIREISGYHSE
jgi:hypothetical protein